MVSAHNDSYSRDEVKRLLLKYFIKEDRDDVYGSFFSHFGRSFNDPVEYHHYAGKFHDNEYKKRMPGDTQGIKHKKAGTLHHNAFEAAWIYHEGLKNNAKPSQTMKNLKRYNRARRRAEDASMEVHDHHNFRLE